MTNELRDFIYAIDEELDRRERGEKTIELDKPDEMLLTSLYFFLGRYFFPDTPRDIIGGLSPGIGRMENIRERESKDTQQ